MSDHRANEYVDPITRSIAEDRDVAELIVTIGIIPGDNIRELLRKGDEDNLLFFHNCQGLDYEEAVRELETRWAERAPKIDRLQARARAKIARAEAAKQARLAEERRRAEESEDRFIAEWDAEICAHPIGHPGHTPHGCT